MPPTKSDLSFDNLLRAGLRVPLQDEQTTEESSQDTDEGQTAEE